MRLLFREWFTQQNRFEVWRQARSQWLAFDGVQAGKTGRCLQLRKGAALLLELVAAGTRDNQFEKNLGDSDPRIAAYCLIGLELLNSPALKTLPKELLCRSETVKILSGHTVVETPLNVFAQEIMRRSHDGRSLERWISFGYKLDRDQLDQHLVHLRNNGGMESSPPDLDTR